MLQLRCFELEILLTINQRMNDKFVGMFKSRQDLFTAIYGKRGFFLNLDSWHVACARYHNRRRMPCERIVLSLYFY